MQNMNTLVAKFGAELSAPVVEDANNVHVCEYGGDTQHRNFYAVYKQSRACSVSRWGVRRYRFELTTEEPSLLFLKLACLYEIYRVTNV